VRRRYSRENILKKFSNIHDTAEGNRFPREKEGRMTRRKFDLTIARSLMGLALPKFHDEIFSRYQTTLNHQF